MTWVMVGATAVTMVAGAVNANKQKKAAKKGADAQERAANAATEEQRRQYDLTRQDQMPFLEGGYEALRRQQAALNGDFSQFNASPDYAFTRGESLKALERGAAARGGFMGGGADADRLQLANGLAAQQFGNYWNRLAGMAGQGQGTAQQLGNLGGIMAGNIGNNLMSIGQSRASSYAAQANADINRNNQIAGAFGGLMGAWGGQRPTATTYPGGWGGGGGGGYGGGYPGFTGGRGTGPY